MNKLEMVKNLAASKNANLMDLAEQIKSLQSSLDSLPPSISQQLEPLRVILDSLPPAIAAQMLPMKSRLDSLPEAIAMQLLPMQSTLDDLPPAIARQIVETAGPLLSLPGQVKQALEAFDQVTAAQRSTIQELGLEMGRAATLSIERRAQALDSPLTAMTTSVHQLGSIFNNVSETASQLKQVPSALNETNTKLLTTLQALQSVAAQAGQGMTKASSESSAEVKGLVENLKEAQGPWWKLPAMLFGVAVLAVLLAPIGIAVSKWLVHDDPVEILEAAKLSPEQQAANAAWASRFWANASQQERALANEIASRPAK